MSELDQTLQDVKALYERVFGWPAPPLGFQSRISLPIGVDPIEHVKREVEHLRSMPLPTALVGRAAWMPTADSFVTENELIIQIDVSGVSREDLSVRVHGGECIVRGERKPPAKLSSMRPLSIERPWGPFERRFTLPVGSRTKEISARSLAGMIELHVPLDESAGVQGLAIDVQ